MILIKKYADGRFYETITKKYLKKEEIASFIENGEKFKITLAKTGTDITKKMIAELTGKSEPETQSAEKSKFEKSKISKAKKSEKSADDKSLLNISGLTKWVGKLVDKKVNDVLTIMNFPTKDQINELEKSIKELSAKLQDITLPEKTQSKPEKKEVMKASAGKKASKSAKIEKVVEIGAV